jgi:hypothetical protein
MPQIFVFVDFAAWHFKSVTISFDYQNIEALRDKPQRGFDS